MNPGMVRVGQRLMILGTGRYTIGAAGTQTSALGFGGGEPGSTVTGATEVLEWNQLD
jgi:hypothetical protein